MARYTNSYIVVWDLDDTLGQFASLNGNARSLQRIAVQLRPDIHAALSEFNRQGFEHVLLTLATRRYAELALQGTGLREAFRYVEGQEERVKGDVDGIAKLFDIDIKEQPHRMIFVGDHPIFDRAQNANVVFHFEPHALIRSAVEVVNLLIELREVGRGSLRGGFNKLYRRKGQWLYELIGKSTSKREEVVSKSLKTGEGILLAAHRDGGATVAFSESPSRNKEPTTHVFIPNEIV